jgi:uncharacterized protein (DUF58 family)
MSTLWWIIIGLLTLAGVLLRNNLLFLLSLFLLLMGGVSLLWTHYCLAEVHYRRRLGSRRLFFGEETDLVVEIVNAKPLPLAWLRAEDELPATLALHATKLAPSHRPGRARLVNVLSLRWYERVTRRYRLAATRRGAWRFGPVELSSGDLFGFALRRQLLDDHTTLLVYPKLAPLTAYGLPARRPFGDLRTARRLLEDPLRLMGARDYAAGDSFRHIHWKATAHRQGLQTKVFEPSAALPLSIFLNVNTYELRYEGSDPDLREYAISAAASIAHWAWENGHPVGLFVNSIAQPEAQRIRIRPSSKPDQLLAILEALAKVVDYGRWPIEAVLQTEAPHLPYGASVIVVSAVTTERLAHALLDLRRREYGVSLVTLGEKAEHAQPRGIRCYHIGGRKEWHELAALALV